MTSFPEPQMPLVPINVLAVCLPPGLCELLTVALVAVPDIHLLNSNAGPGQVRLVSNTASVDVLLVGAMDRDKTLEAAAALEDLAAEYKKARFIVLTERRTDYQETIAFFRSGARGVLCSTELHLDLLWKSIRCVHRGQVWASNELTEYLVAALARPRSRDVTDVSGRPLLTAREQQVLHLLADGMSNYEMATHLGLSGHTIKNHLFRIYEKLGVSNRMEAVLYALTPRTIKPESAAPILPAQALAPRMTRRFGVRA